MDATIHRPSQAEGGKLVSVSPSVGLSLPKTPRQKSPVAPLRSSVTIATREGYDRWAATYDEFPNPLLAREERYLMPLLPDVKEKSVLDIACGTGRWLRKLMERGARFGVGIDSSFAMLQVASRKVGIQRRLAKADCMQLPFRTTAFDYAICSFAMSHIQDLRRMALELARVMKSGAEVIVSDLHPEAYARGWRTGFRDARGACQIEMLPTTEKEIVEVFCLHGFEVLSLVQLRLGDAEREICTAAGKSNVFAEAAQIPAVMVCQFRRVY
jgi:ubiquinone/menaquinone biosynthesis C-methylase UbiE